MSDQSLWQDAVNQIDAHRHLGPCPCTDCEEARFTLRRLVSLAMPLASADDEPTDVSE